MTAETDIVDKNSFTNWLDAQPRQSQRAVIVSLISRTALRMVPFLGRKGKLSHEQHHAFIIYILWRNTLFRCMGSERSYEVFKAEAGVRLRIGNLDFSLIDPAANAAFRTYSSYGNWAGTNEPADAAEIAASSAPDMWDHIRSDASLIEQGVAPFALYERPLFPVDPIWWTDELRNFKDILNAHDAVGKGFPIWLNWYESVSQGNPAFGVRDRETARGLEWAIAAGGRGGDFHEEFWDREPGEINHDIAEWVAEARAAEGKEAVPTAFSDIDFPRQSPNATMFGLSVDGKIVRLAVPPEQRLLVTPQQQKEYEALRDDAARLSGRGQVLGKLSAEISDLSAALPADMTHAYLFDVWRALNRLRRTMNAHVKVAADKEPHEAKLDPGIAEDLGALLDIANNFAFGDPGIRSRDENSIPPQDRPTMQAERQLGDGIVKAALETPELLTLDAASSVRADETNADRAGDDAHGQQAVDQTNKTRKNLFAAILSTLKKAMVGEMVYSWKEYRGGAYKAAGAATVSAAGSDIVGTTTIYPTIWQFITTHAVELLRYAEAVFQNPAVTKVLEQIVKFLGG
jgi:hypothetical protein